MAIIAFIVGLVVGLSIYYWQKVKYDRQLKQMLTSLSDKADLATSFSTTSLVRRELVSLYQKSQTLEEELQFQKALLDKAPIGYLQIDADNQLLWCNQQAQILLKIDRWQPGQVRLLLELVRSYELDRLIEETRDSQISKIQHWDYYPANYIPLSSTEQPKLVSNKAIALKASSYPLPNGQIAVFIENQQPLVELTQSRERAFSDLTHELRTPLTAISLVAETLQKRLENPERRWIEQMLTEIHRLIRLIQDWLEISQLQETAHQSLQYQSLEIKSLILSAWQSVTPLATQKNITLDISPSDTLYLSADRSRLTQVFLNLFDNAIKYSPSDTEIRVQVRQINDRLAIDVIDSGSGFAEADLPHVFDRLYRGDSSRVRSQSYQGSGLGLSIAQQIIHAHNGSIQAKNHPETGGAWIHFTLPIREAR